MIRIYGLMKFLLIKPALKNAHHADGRFTFVRKVKETLFKFVCTAQTHCISVS